MIKYLFVLLFFILSCSKQKQDSIQKASPGIKNHYIQDAALQLILDSLKLKGAVLIYDFKKDQYFSNNFAWTKTGFLPASTFKIANSIIALECGVVENDSTLFLWNSEKRALKNWEQDLTFKQAFHFSCVPCYQEVARKIGLKQMTDYLVKLDYGMMKVDSSNIDSFWLRGDSRISQFEQIDFLKRIFTSSLLITKRTDSIIKKMMVIDENKDFKLSGKTGWSTASGRDNGWFVGFIEVNNDTYFFATNVEPKEDFNMEDFPQARKDVTFLAFKKLTILQ